jgi:DNA-binding MarR family transcriptional regulator
VSDEPSSTNDLIAVQALTAELADEPTASEERIMQAVRRIVQAITVHSKQLHRRSGLTVPQLLCLRAIGRSPQAEVSARDVASAVHLSPGTVSGILDRLERRGLLLRERRQNDRRKVRLNLTAAGEAVVRDQSSLHDRFLSRLRALDDVSRQALLEALETVVTLIGEDPSRP